jgi:hypothetical protein
VSECTRSHAKHRARRAPLRRVPGSLCLAAPADCPLLHHTPYSLSGSITHRICTRWACSWRSFTQAAGCTVKCILQLTAQVEVLTACLPLPTPPLAGHGRRAAPRTLVRNAPAKLTLPLAVVLAAFAIGPLCGRCIRHLPGHYATGNERQTGVVRKRRRRWHGAVLLRWSWR